MQIQVALLRLVFLWDKGQNSHVSTIEGCKSEKNWTLQNMTLWNCPPSQILQTASGACLSRCEAFLRGRRCHVTWTIMTAPWGVRRHVSHSWRIPFHASLPARLAESPGELHFTQLEWKTLTDPSLYIPTGLITHRGVRFHNQVIGAVEVTWSARGMKMLWGRKVEV